MFRQTPTFSSQNRYVLCPINPDTAFQIVDRTISRTLYAVLIQTHALQPTSSLSRLSAAALALLRPNHPHPPRHPHHGSLGLLLRPRQASPHCQLRRHRHHADRLHLRPTRAPPVRRRPPDQIPAWLAALYARVPASDRGPGGHILTGPVAIADAQPGDVLEVRVLKIDITTDFACNGFGAGRGFLPDDFPYGRTKIIPLNRTA